MTVLDWKCDCDTAKVKYKSILDFFEIKRVCRLSLSADVKC